MYRFHPIDTFDFQEELRTGHRQPTPPRNPMKAIGTILLALVLLAFVLAFSGCATVKTTVTSPDGTVTVTESTTTDPAALALAGTVATAYAPPRAHIIREEKSGDIRTILRGRPITKQEIANRWKPLP